MYCHNYFVRVVGFLKPSSPISLRHSFRQLVDSLTDDCVRRIDALRYSNNTTRVIPLVRRLHEYPGRRTLNKSFSCNLLFLSVFSDNFTSSIDFSETLEFQ